MKYGTRLLCLLLFFEISSICFADTIQVRVSRDNDDAEETVSDGDMSRNSPDLELGYDSSHGGLQIVGMRFGGVAIAQGTTISSAYIEFEVDETSSGTTNLIIVGQDTDDAGQFANNDDNISDRTETSASVSWSPSAWSATNQKQQTSDITAIIQEIVNRPGWSSGNDLVIMIKPGSGCTGSSCRRTAESHDGESAAAPLLAVETSTGYSVSSVHGACGDDNLILVEFDGTIDSDALDTGYYSLNSGSVDSVTQQSDTVVVLAVSGVSAGSAYTLTVDGTDHSVDFQGLTGHYFDQRSGGGGSKVSYPTGIFTGTEYLRKDQQLNFSWNYDSPSIFPSVSGNDDYFSVRWVGYIVPTTTGSYEFRLYSDDGMRFDFNGTEIINDWSLHSPRYSSTSSAQALTSGAGYPIEIEHFEQTGQAYAQLQWRRDGGSWEAIPTGNLSACAVVDTSLPDPVFEYRMDEDSWNGTAGEVVDDSGNSNNGIANNGLNTTATAHLCRAGDFDGVNDYIEHSDIDTTLSDTASLSFWIKTTQIGNNTVWQAPGISGVEQSGGTDDIFWGWIDASGHIGISVGNDNASKSSTAINDGSFHHVVLTRDSSSGAYKIYIDGSLDASGTTASGVISTSFSRIGSIDDTGGSPTYFQGQLDELKIFDQVLSDSHVTELYNETRTCDVSSSSCGAGNFPDGASSYGSGSINFGYNARLFNSPDNQLDFNSVSTNGGSFLQSCDSADCSATGNSADVITLPTFVTTSSTTDLNVGWSDTGTLGNSGDEYDDVTVNSLATLNVNPAITTYYIDTLSLGWASELNLQAGDYWIRSLSISSSVTINVTGGTARLYVQENISVGSSSELNSPNYGGEGDASELLIVAYGNVDLGSFSTTSAIVYSQGDVTQQFASYVYGAVTADDVNLNTSAQLHYQSAGVDSMDFGSLCDDDSCSLGSFAISQSTYGLACPQTRATVNVTALCDDGSTTYEDYTGTVSLSGPATSTFYSAASGGSSLANYTFTSGDSGVKTFYLYFNNENSNVQATVADSAASVSSTAATGTDFRAYGFNVTTQPSDFVCGNSTSLTLTAIGRTASGSGEECEVITGFSGSKTLDIWYQVDIDGDSSADTVSTDLVVAGTSIGDQSASAENNVTVSFSSGQANLSLAYANAGEVLAVNIEHDSAPYDGSTGFSSLVASSNSFVVQPAQFAIQASNGAALTSTVSSGGVTQAAGQDFDLQLTAQCSGGSTASDYQPNSSTSLQAAVVRTAPIDIDSNGSDDGTNGDFEVSSGTTITSDTSLSYSVTNIAPGDFSSGVYSFSGAEYSEVGLIDLYIRDASYFGVTNIATSSLSIGRFVPEHFYVTVADVGSFANSCDSSDTDFTYNGEAFGYDVADAPEISIVPRNEDDAVVQNYIGNFQKLNSASMLEFNSSSTWLSSPVTIASTNTGVDSSNLQVSAEYQAGTLSATGSTIDYTLNSSDAFTYIRNANAQVAPFNAAFSIILSGINDGEVSSLETLAGGSSLAIIPSGTIVLRYGRMIMENAFGPETETLKQSVLTQYWNGTSFVVNGDDDCTAVTGAMITSNPVGTGGNDWQDIAVGGGLTDLSFDGTFTNGDGNFEFSAPGAGNVGSVGVTLDLSTLPWLQFDWDSDGADEDPIQKTVTFGQYRSNDRIIYWREISY